MHFIIQGGYVHCSRHIRHSYDSLYDPKAIMEFCQAKKEELQEIITDLLDLSLNGRIPKFLEPSKKAVEVYRPLTFSLYLRMTIPWRYTLPPSKSCTEALFDAGWNLLQQGDAELDRTKQLKALNFLRDAAYQGHVKAQAVYGSLLNEGDLVTKNSKEAEKLLKIAADAGNLEADCDLAIMYECGDNVPKDQKAAALLYSRAAEQGNEERVETPLKEPIKDRDEVSVETQIKIQVEKKCSPSNY